MSADRDGPAQRALGAGAWSMSELLFGLDSLLDDEGRPIAERRAPSHVKAGVPIELVPCPYDDERKGQPMNASALEQVHRHLKAVFADVGSFHATLGARRGWAALALAVIDQLSGPAFHVLQTKQPSARVPATTAVGHKLAAGYFGVICRALAAELRGNMIEHGVDGFLAFVHAEGALIGASEACAGPPHLIRRTTEVFLRGDPDALPLSSPTRVVVAECLLEQLELAAAWRCFDESAEHALLEKAGDRITPANSFLAQALSGRRVELERTGCGAAWAPSDDTCRKLELDDPRALALLAMRSYAGDAAQPAHALEALVARREGALRFADADTARMFARTLRAYAEVLRRVLVAQLWSERRLRKALGMDGGAPFHATGLLVSAPRALRWLRAAHGPAVAREPTADPTAAPGVIHTDWT